MTTNDRALRQYAHEQALASTMISGHEPSSEFLADCQAVVDGAITREEARARSLVRAIAADKAAQAAGDTDGSAADGA